MSAFDDNVAALNSLPHWKAVAVLAACVERVAPVFLRLARPASGGVFQKGLEALWSASLGKGSEGEDLRRLCGELKALPESEEQDSHHAAYHAMVALSILSYAAEFASLADERAAQWALGAAVDIRNGLDTLREAEPGQAWVSDPQDPAAAGALEARELREQGESMASVLTVGQPSVPFVDNLRASAIEAARVLDVAVVELRERGAWTA